MFNENLVMINSREINFKSIGALILTTFMVLAFSTLSFSQQLQQQATPELREDFTKTELESFLKANEKVLNIQAESQKKMVKAIKEEGLSVDRFNQIIAAQQDPQKENDASSKEMASFNNAAEEIMTEKKETETEIVKSIEQEGIDIKTYQEIMYAYQKSPKVKKKISSMIDN